MRKCWLFFLLLAVLTRCVPPTEEKFSGVNVDITNPEIQKLYDLQNVGQTDSLLSYFTHKNSTYRYLSALAFASIQDSAAADGLLQLLLDPVDEVRIAAAYALGQIGKASVEDTLAASFDNGDTVGVSRFFNAAVLEAIGKCGTAKSLENITKVTGYKLRDTVLLEGQAMGIYRFGLRRIVSPEGTAKMLDFATSAKYPPTVRLMGAHYLARVKEVVLENGDSLLAPALAREDDARVRMALALALGKTNSERAGNALLYQYNIESDYRVKCNILRALGNFDYEKVKPTAYQALNDPNTAVAVTAAEYFTDHGKAEEASTYWQLAKNPGGRWQVQLQLYAAAAKHLPYGFEESRKFMNWELRRRFESAGSPYEKAAALKALAGSGWNYRYIRDAGFASGSPVVRSGAVEALSEIARIPNFNAYFGGGFTARRELTDCLQDAIESADPGMAAVAAATLRDTNLFFKETFDSIAILENTLKKLRLPQEVETFIELKKTIAYFKGTPVAAATAKEKSSAKKIDWKLVTDLKENSRAVIKTKKGNVTLELMPLVAPGAVANFVALVQEKFFDGKKFHRIVPNFVVQTGCPRGDGYGSLNFTIRTEVPYLHYDQAGLVGMARAEDLHTEATQFFITHSPTPHLDGKYTIFAKVVDGMDVVNKLELGDTIDGITIEEIKL